MLRYTQLFITEVGATCNLSGIHIKCPAATRKHYDIEVSNDKRISLMIEAWQKYNFRGIYAFHYYNEPMLESSSVFNIIQEVRKVIPESKYMLWTNGTHTPIDDRMKLFDYVKCTNYFHKDDLESYYKSYIDNVDVFYPYLDNRLDDWHNNQINQSPCLRALIELVIDNYGFCHLCCYDFNNEIELGNVLNDDLGLILKKRDVLLEMVCREGGKPEKCLRCKGKSMGHPFVCEIYEAGREYYK
jgi:MoaA/NifB/PqqE/SkfB family radical SAM enzyme